MKQHSQRWRETAEPEKKFFAERASRIANAREDQRQQAIEVELQALRQLDKDIAEQARGESVRMTTCAWDAATNVEFQDLFDSDRWSPQHVRNLRDLSGAEPVAEPHFEILSTLRSMPVDDEVVHVASSPDWLGWMCEHRDFFSRCLLRWHEDVPNEEAVVKIFRFVFAYQNPLLVCVVAVEQEEYGQRLVSPADFFNHIGAGWQHKFRSTWCLRYSDDGVFDAARDIEVLPNAMYVSSGCICSASEWQSLASLEQVLPRRSISRPKRAKQDEHEQCEQAVPEPWMEYPAMWEFLKEKVEVVARRKRFKTTPDHGDDPHHEVRMDGDQAVAELVRRRVELAKEVDDEELRNSYSVNIRGGKWTGENKGVAYDCYACYAINSSLAAEFVQSFSNVRSSASWSIRAYGDVAAHVLAMAWGHRHHHFLNRWVAVGCPEGHKFSEEDIGLYSEPDALRGLASDAVGPLADRIRQIREMVPK